MADQPPPSMTHRRTVVTPMLLSVCILHVAVVITLTTTPTVDGFMIGTARHGMPISLSSSNSPQSRVSVSAVSSSSSSSSSSSDTSENPQRRHQQAEQEPARGRNDGERRGDHHVLGLSRRDAFTVAASTATTTTSSGLILLNQPKPVWGSTNELLTSSGSSVSSSSITTAAAGEGSGVPTIALGKSNLRVSRTIQGHWQLAGGHGRYKEDEAIANMAAHFKAGITTLDTADIYGPSELIVGKFVQSQPAAIPCTKFCCFRFLDEITRDEVKTRIKSSCERLQVSKLPLIQFFWSNLDIKKYIDVALWLTELKEEGLIGEIGATNFDLQRLQEFKKNDVPLVSHQVQLSALDRRPVQSGMVQWCAENSISLIAFGTVGSGILSDDYYGKSAPAKEQLKTASLRMYAATAQRFGTWELVQELLDTMRVIAADVQKDRCPTANISNIAQRYVLQTPAVASIIVGVRNQSHIADNVNTHSFQLKPEEIAAIDKVVAKRKGPTGDVWDIERGTLQ